MPLDAVIAGVSSAISLAQQLREISSKMANAEIKMLAADLSLALADVKKQLADTKHENFELRQKCVSLESEVAQLKIDLDVEKQSASLPVDWESGPHKDSIVAILLFLSKHESQDVVFELLATVVKKEQSTIKLIMEVMGEHKLVHRQLFMGRASTYSITSKGRKFLFDRGLIK